MTSYSKHQNLFCVYVLIKPLALLNFRQCENHSVVCEGDEPRYFEAVEVSTKNPKECELLIRKHNSPSLCQVPSIHFPWLHAIFLS